MFWKLEVSKNKTWRKIKMVLGLSEKSLILLNLLPSFIIGTGLNTLASPT